MISRIQVKALKSIRDVSVDCSNLNIFTGVNSSGKSTFLQALLIVSQRALSDDCLNGQLLSLGEFREARNFNMPGSDIVINLWDTEHKEPTWLKLSEKKNGSGYEIKSPDENTFNVFGFEDEACPYPHVQIYGYDLHYLSCHRIGSRDIYEKNMQSSMDFGTEGEYAFAYLLKNMDDPIDKELTKTDSGITNSLLEQVNYWLNYIVGTTLLISDIKKTSYLQVKYNNNPKNRNQEALYCRPANVGSGISYLISILITCLASQKCDAIIMENPEIHLHPKAQSRLCEFLYFISSKRRQIFIETHSDHIFNGIRVGIALGTMRQENISVNFFALNDNCETQNNPIKFGEFGKIIGTNDNMDINDLFDQFEIDVDRMLGIANPKD